MTKSRIAAIVFLLILLISLFSCTSHDERDDGRISVVCTAFPQYDWTREIIGRDNEKFDVVYLTDSGVDMHSYQPTADDIIKISECDILVSVGGTSEKWIDEAVNNVRTDDFTHLRLIDILGDKIMYTADNHDGHSHPIDEHVWLSLKNAVLFCEAICEAVCSADGENAESYRENAEEYISDLREVDGIVEEFVSTAPRDTVIMADRFPFRYTFRDYGINCCAAFEGCTSDSEVTFETVIHLAQTADRLGLKVILAMDDSDGKIADSVISNAKSEGIEVYKLNSMQSVSTEDIKNGITYITAMRDNLALIHGALIA